MENAGSGVGCLPSLTLITMLAAGTATFAAAGVPCKRPVVALLIESPTSADCADA